MEVAVGIDSQETSVEDVATQAIVETVRPVSRIASSELPKTRGRLKTTEEEGETWLGENAPPSDLSDSGSVSDLSTEEVDEENDDDETPFSIDVFFELAREQGGVMRSSPQKPQSSEEQGIGEDLTIHFAPSSQATGKKWGRVLGIAK